MNIYYIYNEIRNLEKEEYKGMNIEGNNVDNVWSIKIYFKML